MDGDGYDDLVVSDPVAAFAGIVAILPGGVTLPSSDVPAVELPVTICYGSCGPPAPKTTPPPPSGFGAHLRVLSDYSTDRQQKSPNEPLPASLGITADWAVDPSAPSEAFIVPYFDEPNGSFDVGEVAWMVLRGKPEDAVGGDYLTADFDGDDVPDLFVGGGAASGVAPIGPKANTGGVFVFGTHPEL